jgi:hypothetical protein
MTERLSKELCHFEIGPDRVRRQVERVTSRPRAAAILLGVALSLLFVVVYGGCNAIAARRGVVATCLFQWELHIPLVPILIVPYFSIDLLFVCSFLLCSDGTELTAHAKRIAAAIVLAGVAFVLFPLKTGYPHPVILGWQGDLFGFLWSFDRPHNLVPSLHVAFASLLWPIYFRRASRRMRPIVHAWFVLILVSPLLTWQHHVIDVATGGLLAQLVMFAFPEWRKRPPMKSREAGSRIAWLYASASAVLGMSAILLGSWFLSLLWPSASLALVALAYMQGTSALFRKANGRLPLSTRVVLGPYLFAARMRLLFYRRHRKPWFEAAPGVYCGRLLRNREAAAVRSTGVTGVLDMTAEHDEAKPFLEVDYLNVPVLDLTRPSQEQVEVAVGFIREHAARGGVYVHCALGLSRSIAVTAAYTAEAIKQLSQR